MDAGGGIETRGVDCPYCGERVELLLESDLRGEMVQDCEVCCNPWQVRVVVEGGDLRVEVRALDR